MLEMEHGRAGPQIGQAANHLALTQAEGIHHMQLVFVRQQLL